MLIPQNSSYVNRIITGTIMQPLALDFEESPPIIATMWRGRPHNELQSWYKWRTKPDHYISHNLSIFSPGRDLTFDSATKKSTAVC